MKKINITTKVKHIDGHLNSLYPYSLQEEWDNCGLLQKSHKNKDVKKVLIALDSSIRTIEYAIQKKCDLIVTHHPLINKKDVVIKRRIELLKKNNIALISLHTCFDKHEKGMNYGIIKKLPVKKIYQDKNGYIYHGKLLKKLSIKEFLKVLENNLNPSRIIPYLTKEVKNISSIALCAGGSGSMVKDLIGSKVDCYLAGDIKWHDHLDANENGISIIDLNHDLEDFFVDFFEEVFKKQYSNLEIFKIYSKMKSK